MKIFILFLVLQARGNYQITATTQEFDSQVACANAAQAITRSVQRLNVLYVDCHPKGSK